jgi:tRNA (adenine57-N1/adenine58-N1)-methyltransferase
MDKFLESGEKVLLLDSRGRRYLVTLQAGGTFHFHRGIVAHDDLIGAPEGTRVRSTRNEVVVALRPTLADYVLKMSRGAQIVYPKDIGPVLLRGDIFPGATVVEAGAGSGSLTLALLRAVGPSGRVITYEMREDFAAQARANVEAFMGEASNLEIRLGNVYEGIAELDVDRVVLDLPEPWRALGPAARSLRPGGILLAYLPTILQVHQLVEAMKEDPCWALDSTDETLFRTWHVDTASVRPDHRMVAHTGFITTTRRIGPEPAPLDPPPGPTDPASGGGGAAP